MKALIAEIGNFHLGSLEKACDLIRVAKECGATHVKMQAIPPSVPVGGSMPEGFYAQCSMSVEQYIECVAFGNVIGIPVFFSYFDDKYKVILKKYPNMLKKISASQFTRGLYDSKDNNPKTIISIPRDGVLSDKVSKMNIVCVTPYNYAYSDISFIDRFKTFFKKDIGLSDHSVNTRNCRRAITEYGCNIIEKHFYLGEEVRFEGVLYRDCVHAANPRQFTELAQTFQEYHK